MLVPLVSDPTDGHDDAITAIHHFGTSDITRCWHRGAGCFLNPEAAVSIRMAMTSTIGACRFAAASHALRWSYRSAWRGAWDHEKSREFFTFTRPVLPGPEWFLDGMETPVSVAG